MKDYNFKKSDKEIIVEWINNIPEPVVRFIVNVVMGVVSIVLMFGCLYLI